MSGSSWDDMCPNCNGEMLCHSNTSPFDFIIGECLECGFYYAIKTGQEKLKNLNEYREFLEMEPLKRRRKSSLDPELKR